MAELQQGTGARTQHLFGKEAVWGEAPALVNNVYKEFQIVNESMDENTATYRSGLIRSDRMKNPSVLGSESPGGGISVELAARRMPFFLWALLGGSVATTVGSGTAANEVQTVTITGAPTGGTFTLTFDGQTTAAIAYNATAAAVDSALEALPNVGPGQVSCTGGPLPGTAVTVTFGGLLADTNVPQMTASASFTGGTTPAVTIATSTQGGTGAGKNTHIFSGTTNSALPSFVYEKGFLDLATPQYMQWLGTRINSIGLTFGVDQTVAMAIDAMSREVPSATGVSISDPNTIHAQPQLKPFTSVQCVLYKNNLQLATANSLSLNIANNLNGDSGRVIGSRLRQNLPAGARDITGSGTFIFDSLDLYDLAKNQTELSLRIACADADGYAVQFRMDAAQFLPTGNVPKVDSDGPLVINTDFEAFKDAVSGTDLTCTVINDETGTLLIGGAS